MKPACLFCVCVLCSMTEFRSCLSLMGLFITEEEFELVNLTYPHHEKDKDDDKGISE